MKKQFYLFIAVILLLAGSKAVHGQAINDHIFPAAAIAKPYIDFDSKGFLVNGRRTFIVSAGLEYARVPHQLWYDRLLRIKRAGFNCVEIYTIWNFHEAEEGKFDFSGDRDLNAFLALVKKLGMYAIVRVGPYYCAEWDSGGYPIWLKFKKGLRVREHNKLFEQYVDRFFDKLLPLIFKNQVNNGGAVILVQLENEHTKGWGTVMPDGYFKHLQSKALSLGLQVPYFFSGLHHASDPAGNGKLDDASRPNPWFSTEFWSVWYSQYGAKPGDDTLYDRRTWKIIAHGGNGYNYYMAHGGSNFGYTNNDEDAASYDYGAAIGQAGDLRPIYYIFKRAAWFSRSFQEILENSSADSLTYNNLIGVTALKITARTSTAGDVIFIDNPGKNIVKTKLKGTDAVLSLAPGEIYPMVHNFKISQDITLDWAYTRIFAVLKQQNTTTIIVDAETGSPLSLHFSVKGMATTVTPSPLLKINTGKVDIAGTMPAADKPSEYFFTVGTQNVRVLAMNRQWTDRTWLTDAAGRNYIISGAPYVGDITQNGQSLSIETEKPLLAQKQNDVWLYTGKSALVLNKSHLHTTAQPLNLPLSTQQFKTAAVAASLNYNTSNWLQTPMPLQMGADGDVTADAWYKTMLNTPLTGKYTLQVKGGGRGQAFIDGHKAAAWKLDANEVMLYIKKGRHSLTIFTAHDGRDKLAAYTGPIDNVDRKGIFGSAVIKKGGPFITKINNWYFAKAVNRDAIKQGPPRFDTTHYKKYTIGADAFNLKEGFGWFQTVIPKPAAGTPKITLSFKSVDENATVFVNEKKLMRSEGWNIPFEISITDAAVLKKPIVVTLFIENYSNEGGIDQPVYLNAIGKATAVTGWKMKGGPGDPDAPGGWRKINAAGNSINGPCFYRAQFTVDKLEGQTFIWRVEPKNLGHGSIWVNGHHIGRYPEKMAITSLYIPECWLKNGINNLVIYDEDGKRPDDIQVIAEPAAGRISEVLSADIE